MPNAVVMTGYGPPEVLKWAGVPLREPGEGQIRIRVKAIPLPPNAVLGFEAAGTVDAVGPGVTGTSRGSGVTFSQYTNDRAPGALDETIALLADGRLRLRAHKTMPMQQAALAHRQLESGTVHERIILTLQ